MSHRNHRRLVQTERHGELALQCPRCSQDSTKSNHGNLVHTEKHRKHAFICPRCSQGSTKSNNLSRILQMYIDTI